MRNLYIIEARTPDGSLDLSGPQPESVFGVRAIVGMNDWDMSRVIYQKLPDAVLRGDNILHWPSLIDSRWVARHKTW